MTMTEIAAEKKLADELAHEAGLTHLVGANATREACPRCQWEDKAAMLLVRALTEERRKAFRDAAQIAENYPYDAVDLAAALRREGA